MGYPAGGDRQRAGSPPLARPEHPGPPHRRGRLAVPRVARGPGSAGGRPAGGTRARRCPRCPCGAAPRADESPGLRRPHDRRRSTCRGLTHMSMKPPRTRPAVRRAGPGDACVSGQSADDTPERRSAASDAYLRHTWHTRPSAIAEAERQLREYSRNPPGRRVPRPRRRRRRLGRHHQPAAGRPPRG